MKKMHSSKTAEEYFASGLAYHNQADFQNACHDYSKVIELNPWYAEAYNNLCCLYYDQRQFDKALEYLNKAIEISPFFSDYYYNRGNVYRHKGYESNEKKSTDMYFCKALADYRESLRLKPNQSFILNIMGDMYIRTEEFDLAYHYYDKMIPVLYPGEDTKNLVLFVDKNNLDAGIDFTAKLIGSGFYLRTAGNPEQGAFIKPENRTDRTVLFFNKLHIGKTIRRHLKTYSDRYELRINRDINPVINRCIEKYGNGMLTHALCHYFNALGNTNSPVQPVSFQLLRDQVVVAGDIGVLHGGIYTSYSGYHDEPSAGTAQIILTARYLEKNGLAFMDFGPLAGCNYKLQLGGKVFDFREFRSLYFNVNNNKGAIYENTRNN
ncbi:hypothetical protein AGMMS50230_08250 [Spirochaetia bacterium]|nr:hypothetical protein AGMMS50230_08250 [Spirochaetia bacterium]